MEDTRCTNGLLQAEHASLACVGRGWSVCAATAIDHIQMLTDEVEEWTRPVVGRDGGASPGRAVLSRRVVFAYV